MLYDALMCNRFTLTHTEAEWLAAELGIPVEAIPKIEPRYNLPPTDPHWIVRQRGEDRELLPARWGLVNHWAKDRKRASQQTNARVETLLEKPAYREAFLGRRCVVPADGFYEWTGPKTARQPLWFHRPDHGLFFFAGMYETWWPPEGERERTFSIITGPPNRLMEPIHNRMPIVIPGDLVDDWLYRRQGVDALMKLLAPPPEDLFVITPVSPRVNSVKNDDAACIERVELPVPFIG